MNAQTDNRNPLAAFATSRDTSEELSRKVAKTPTEPDAPEPGELFSIEEPTNTKAIRG